MSANEEISSTREITNWLRGLAIITVLVSHFINLYNADFYYRWMDNYANALIAIFFILSGFGAYHSLERRLDQSSSTTTRVMVRYFWDRAKRIYPLYWIAFFLAVLVKPGDFDVIQIGLHWKLAAELVAFPLVITPFWFITSIVQCYIFAPLIFLIFKKLGWRRYLLLNMVLMLVFWQISEHYSLFLGEIAKVRLLAGTDFYSLLYRNVFLGHVLLFSLGILLAYLVETNKGILKNKTPFYVSAFLLSGYLLLLRYDRVALKIDIPAVEMFFYSVLFVFCLLIIRSSPRLPFRKFLTTSGQHSYSIYLFHPLFYQILIFMGILQQDHLLSIIATLALLPVMFAACYAAERAQKRLAHNGIASKKRSVALN